MITFWQKSEIYSPALCRLMARKKGGKPMTTLDICNAATSLTPAQVESISQSTDWSHIDIVTAEDFLKAVSMDFCCWADMHRASEYLKSRPTFEHLRRAPEWKSYWLPLLVRWRKSYGFVNKNQPIWPPLRDLLIRMSAILPVVK
jgi:hypothetical protein